MNNEVKNENENVNNTGVSASNVSNASPVGEINPVSNVSTVNNVSTESSVNPASEPSVSGASPLNNVNSVNNDGYVPSASFKVEEEEKFVVKEKKKWPIVSIIILLILGGLFYYYYFVMTKPSTLFSSVINGVYNSLSNKIESRVNDVKNYDKGEVTGKLILTSENADLVLMNGLTINGSIGYDKDNKKIYMDASGSLLGIEVISGKMLSDSENLYFNIKNSTDTGKTYKTKLDESASKRLEYSDEVSKSVTSYKYILNVIKNSFLGSVSESKIKKAPVLKSVNDKKVPAYKVEYTYDKDEYVKSINAVLNGLMNDSKALEELVNVHVYESVDAAKDDLKKELDELSADGFETINVEMYTDILNSSLLELNMYRKDNKINITVNGNSYNAIMSMTEDENTDTLSLSYDSAENRYVFDMDVKNVTTEEKKSRTKLSIVYKENKSSDKKTEYSLSVKYYDPNNTEKEYFIVDATGEYNSVDEIKSFDTSDAIDYDSLSDEEKAVIINSIMNTSE